MRPTNKLKTNNETPKLAYYKHLKAKSLQGSKNGQFGIEYCREFTCWWEAPDFLLQSLTPATASFLI